MPFSIVLITDGANVVVAIEMDERAIIDEYFRPLMRPDPSVSVGIGDDAAVLQPPSGEALVLTCDRLVADVHLPACAPARSWGWRLAAVNLSDLGAMAATPRWALLDLTLAEADPRWLAPFARGLGDALAGASVTLIGGNMSRGLLAASLTLVGTVPVGLALERCGARPGDGLYVTGKLGAAALGLRAWQGGVRGGESLRPYLEPEPPWRLGIRLRGIATAAIDLSDGFLMDVDRLLVASGVGADVELDRLPLAEGLERDREEDWSLAITAGDDYELCLCIPERKSDCALAHAHALGITLTRVGTLSEEKGLRLSRRGQRVKPPPLMGHDHFRRGP